MDLNGLWDYAITQKGINQKNGMVSILVPYPVESALSGVRKKVTEKENLWYKRTFTVPNVWKKKHLLLNFEACDWETTVWVDGKEAGIHRGGYDPFTFDITELLGHTKLMSYWYVSGIQQIKEHNRVANRSLHPEVSGILQQPVSGRQYGSSL